MDKRIQVKYTNWKGNTRVRTIEPLDLWWGSTEYHKEEQFLLSAVDVETQEVKDFALKDCDFRGNFIREWSQGSSGI